MSTAKSKTIKLFCPSLSKLVPFVAYEDHRLDLGTIARTFGLDPATLRLNGHFVSRGVNLISSVTWKSLLSFFDSRGFSTGTNGRDAVIVDGKLCRPDVANGGLHNPSNNGNGDDPKTTEDDGVGIKRKPQSEDVKFLKKRKMDRRSSDNKPLHKGFGESARLSQATRTQRESEPQLAMAPSTAGPSRERRSKRNHDKNEKMAPRMHPEVNLGKFRYRKVVFEVSVEDKFFGEFELLDRLLHNDWAHIFDGTYHSDACLVRSFYSVIHKASMNPLGFDIPFGRKMVRVNIEVISKILGAPLGKVHINVKNMKKKHDRNERIMHLCGKLVEWKRGSSVAASDLLFPYRLLHHICTYNLYPRTSNRTECSRFMIELLYQVGQGAQVCLPTIVLTQIVKAATSTRGNATLPFGRLICRLARKYGIKGSNGDPDPMKFIDDTTINHMNIGPKLKMSRLENFGDEIEEEEEESEGEEEAEKERADETLLALQEIRELYQLLDTRMERQEKLSKKLYSAIRAVLCCVQKEGAPPLSPNSEDQ